MAQYEQLLHATYPEKYATLLSLFQKNQVDRDTVAVIARLNAMHSYALRNHDNNLALDAELLTIRYRQEARPENYAAIVNNFEKLILKARNQKNKSVEINAVKYLGHFYWHDMGNYELAFENYIRLEPLLNEVSGEEFPEKALFLNHIGEAYYFFADYQKAIEIARLALPVFLPKQLLGVRNFSSNTIGLSYMKTGKLDSADFYFRQILDYKIIADYDVWKGIAEGGMAQTAYLRGDYNTAIILFQRNVAKAREINDPNQVAKGMVPLADLYLRKNRLSEVPGTLKIAREFIAKSAEHKQLEYFFQVMGKYHAALGNMKLTYAYLDSANAVKEQQAIAFNTLQLLRATQKIQLQQHRAEIASAASEKQIKTLERNILFALIIILLMLALYGYITQRRKSESKEQAIYDQLHKAEEEIASSSRQLEEFTRNISERNVLMEQLEEKFSAITYEGDILELQQITILTDEQWERFRRLFEKVHGGYLLRLKEKLPGLTPAEIRFMALAKLGLTYKEMANTLGISTQSVRVIWHRIRKKLHLPEESSLADLIEKI